MTVDDPAKLTTTQVIVEAAQRELAAIDEKIAHRRADRKNVAAEIAQLTEQRKQLQRIVNAARGRKANGDE